MREYIYSFLTKTCFKEEEKQNVIEALDVLLSEIGEDPLKEITNQYKNIDLDYSDLLSKWRSTCSSSSLHPYQIDLLFVIALCERLESLYAENGLPESLFIETMKDISYKVRECKLVKGIYGTFVVTWFEYFFSLKRFAFGRLQFEVVPFGYEFEDIHIDTPSINVHIPRTGGPLDPKAVEESFKLADQFYKKQMGNCLLYRCSSWLLFPRNRDLLSADSNIVQFMNLWTPVSTHYFDGYGELWRLFDCEFVNADSLPADSSLRRGYISLVKNNEKIGGTLGFLKRNV
ncbi:MAG: acyltransferase domain-containing protein [Bacilli bacterium]|nr:acyltransferase domain-containing protein [Bacilli bacterium]